jgi:hypothetical protein
MRARQRANLAAPAPHVVNSAPHRQGGLHCFGAWPIRSSPPPVNGPDRITARRGRMTDKPIDLDEHRGMSAQKETDIRRRLYEVQADQAALRQRQEELEKLLLSAPATNWPEAAAKARYLIELFAATPEARDPRRQKLIENVLDDLKNLSV